MDDAIHVAIPSDANYLPYAAITASSIARFSSLPVVVHLLDGGIAEDCFILFMEILSQFPQCRVMRHGLDMNMLDSLGKWHGSSVTYSRLFLADILPDDVDWVVSADADILFLGDAAKLWELRDGNSVIMPSRDSPPVGDPYNKKAIEWFKAKGLEFENPEEYFCVGLCLLNLREIRRCGYAKRFLDFRLAYPDLPYPDQTVLNYVLKKKKKLLPAGWGVFSGDANENIDWLGPLAVHYVEDTPWRRSKPTHLVSDAVLLWRVFAKSALGKHSGILFPAKNGGIPALRVKGESISGFCARRAVYLLLKKTYALLRLVPFLHRHFRNANGIPDEAMRKYIG